MIQEKTEQQQQQLPDQHHPPAAPNVDEKWQQQQPSNMSTEDRMSVTDKSLIDQESALSNTNDEDLPPRKLLWVIPLAPHVNPIRFVCFLFAVFVSMSVIVYFAAAQAWTLSSVLMISENTGDATGSLGTYSEVMSVVAVVVWGTLSDRISKRSIMSISLMIMGIITIAYPHANNLYPTLLILRLIYSVGTAGTTCMMAAMMVEAMHKKNGILAAMIGACTGLGAIFAVFCLFDVPSQLSYMQDSFTDPINIIVSYAIIGAVCTALGLILWPAMPPTIHRVRGEHSFKNFFLRLWNGTKAAKDPRIALAFVTSFFARSDEVIVSNFISLWVQQYYIEKGVCQVGASCYQGMASTSTMTGIAQAVALVSAVFFGGVSEYLPREIGVLCAGIIGAVGCLPFSMSVDPTSNTSLAYVILIAIGQYGK